MAAVTYEILIPSLLILLLSNFNVDCIKLNVPRVLLPYTQSVSANFTLEVTDGGCFRWYISRPEVIKLHVIDAENKGCSSKAVVSSNSKVPTLQSTLVTLINDETGESLHCDVSVTSINRLEIVTTTRELLLEDTPEAFTIRALDKEGDTFSSLDGLVFNWNLITTSDDGELVDARYVLRFIKFSESLYKASPAIYALESENKQGSTVLVQGIKTGSAIVRATLKDAAYPKGLTTEVNLSVVANLILSPSYEVHLLVGSVLAYQVLVIQQGKAQRVSMPSEQFSLQLTDNKIASLNSQTSEVEALSVGYTEVILKDLNIKSRLLFRQPSAGIHVVSAHHLEFSLIPHQNWQLIRQQRYIVLIKLLDRNNSEIFGTDNIRIKADFPEEYFKVHLKTVNGSYYDISALTVGNVKISAKLEGIINKNGDLIGPDQLIEDRQPVEIVERITILPNLVNLPWNSMTKSTHNIHFQAFGGGSSGYYWKTNSPSVAVCSQSGDVTTKQNGSVNVTVSSLRNPHNYAIATINILQPGALEILSSKVEVEVGEIIHLPVAIYTVFEKKRTAFTQCEQYPVEVEIASENKLQYLPDNQSAAAIDENESCVLLPVKGLQPGFTKVNVAFDGGDVILKNSTVVAVYQPLTIVSPTDDEVLLLSLGASFSVVYQGGPKPWHLSSQNFYRNLAVTNITIASAKLDSVDRKLDDLHVFTVMCKELGETSVELQVGNRISATNPKPVVSEATLKVICSVPSVMELKPLIAQPKSNYARQCHHIENRFAVQCYRIVDITVSMKDHLGRLFDNFTSIGVSWELSNPNLASITGELNLLSIENIYDGYTTLNRTYQTLSPNGVEGSLKVTAKANSYLPRLTSHFKAESGFDLKAHLYLELVEDAQIVDEISVFNHPQNKVLLAVVKGSGHFDFEPKDQSVAAVNYDEKMRQFVIVPKSEGLFTLTLYDVCLESKSQASAVVKVSGINRVEVNMVDKVGVNKEITSYVRILDKDNFYLPSSVFNLLDVRAIPASPIISVRPLTDCQSPKDVLCFAVQGKSLGQTMLKFTVTLKRILSADLISESLKSSDPLPIQVFSPLRLHPRNVTLIIGATFQVSSSGGPLPQSSIEYSIDDGNIASVNNAGIITGLTLGKTTIVGRAVGIDSETGSNVVFSQDILNVYIIALSGIRIRARLNKVEAGSVIPVYAVGVHDYETPFTFGSAIPFLRFKWSVNNKEVASLEPVYQHCGIQLQEENQFMIRLRANSQGQVALFLKVSVNSPAQNGLYQIQSDEVLTDELQIEVFDKLRLISPPTNNQDILITPNTALKVTTNKDRLGYKLQYRLTDTTCPDIKDISVDGNGNLVSAQSICRSTLFVSSSDEVGFNQTISSLVVVKPISYMMIKPKCSVRMKHDRLLFLPIGTKTLFQVQFHDNFGREFHATNSQLKFIASRNDLIQVLQGPQNGTFYVKVTNPGYTVLRVWDAENLGVDDYILISSGEVIQPSKAILTLGDFICFSSPFSTVTDGEFGSWSSDNSFILKINSSSGLAFASNIGVTTVTQNVSSEIATSTEISVIPIKQVNFHPSNVGKQLSNAPLGKRSFFPLVLLAEQLSNGKSNLHGKSCDLKSEIIDNSKLPYKCDLWFLSEVEEPAEALFKVSAYFDITSGRHGCVVESKAQSSELLLKLSTVKSSLLLNASVWPQPQQQQVASDPLPISFNPAFHVLTNEIHFGGVNLPLSFLAVSANDAVFSSIIVTANDSMLLEVGTVQSDSTDGSKKLYPVRLSEHLWQRLSELNTKVAEATVNVISPLTSQAVAVPVSIKVTNEEFGQCRPVDRSGWQGLLTALAESYSSIIFTLLVVFCTIIAMVIGYQALLKSKSNEMNSFYANRSGSGEGRSYPSVGRSFNGSSYVADRSHLWSVNEPVLGSPSFTKTPSPRFRNASDRF